MDSLDHFFVWLLDCQLGYMYICLGGGFKQFYFCSYLGKIPILTNIFQRG